MSKKFEIVDKSPRRKAPRIEIRCSPDRPKPVIQIRASPDRPKSMIQVKASPDRPKSIPQIKSSPERMPLRIHIKSSPDRRHSIPPVCQHSSAQNFSTLHIFSSSKQCASRVLPNPPTNVDFSNSVLTNKAKIQRNSAQIRSENSYSEIPMIGSSRRAQKPPPIQIINLPDRPAPIPQIRFTSDREDDLNALRISKTPAPLPVSHKSPLSEQFDHYMKTLWPSAISRAGTQEQPLTVKVKLSDIVQGFGLTRFCAHNREFMLRVEDGKWKAPKTEGNVGFSTKLYRESGLRAAFDKPAVIGLSDKPCEC